MFFLSALTCVGQEGYQDFCGYCYAETKMSWVARFSNKDGDVKDCAFFACDRQCASGMTRALRTHLNYKIHREASMNAIFSAIEMERQYQTDLNTNVLSVGEEIALVIKYTQKALDAWSENFQEEETEALGQLRKVAAICVRAPHET